jgi:uncharacterized membrane protein
MTPTILLAFLNIGIALLCAGLSVPLILRKVPMNRLYGVRFPQSFKSNEAWYEINEFGGKALLIATVPILLVGLYGFLEPPRNYSLLGAAVVVVSVMMACLASYIKARAVDKKNG